jgi:hypothetical protein
MPTSGDCDEFPFRTTAEGGPGLPYWIYPAQPTKAGADIQPINSIDNETQGGILSYFYTACRVTPGSRFFVVPVPFLPKTMWNGSGCG